jgi:hypothetical protein
LAADWIKSLLFLFSLVPHSRRPGSSKTPFASSADLQQNFSHGPDYFLPCSHCLILSLISSRAILRYITYFASARRCLDRDCKGGRIASCS